METDDYTDDDDSDNDGTQGNQDEHKRKPTHRKKKDSILGGLETENSSISDDADP